MTTTTIIYIIIALIIALFLALFQYKFREKKKLTGIYILLFSLRTLTIFGVLLLLINPKFRQSTSYNVKPNLVIAVDNSESIEHLGRTESAKNFLSDLKNSQELNNTFNVEYYTFGSKLNQSDTLNFKENKSNLAMVFDRLEEVYNSDVSPTIVVTDGNQTFGRDYVLASRSFKQQIYPVILGDTTVFTDLKIQQLNANRYSYLNNRFPVEVIAVYNGSENVNTKLNIRSGSAIVYSQPLQFSGNKNSEVVSFTLSANSVGIAKYSAEIVPLEEEKNKINNYKEFAVEVINQKTNVAIITDIIHPDLGTFKKSIESNKQRSAEILKPNEFLSRLNDFQMAIIYQPKQSFKAVLDAVENAKMNKLLVTGPSTSFQALNSFQSNFQQEITNQTEDYQPVLDNNYSIFNIDKIDFNDYPPLKSEFGSLTFTQPLQTILYKSINGIKINEPLLATFEYGNSKEALLNGEGIWKWRAQSFRSTGDFEAFDDFFGKLIQYLSTNQPRSRISVNYESIYRETDEILITAQYFNKGYEFDGGAVLNIVLKNKVTDETSTFPLVINASNYQIDLSGLLSPGDYDFTVSVSGENLSRSGQISILDYNVEQQFLNADVNRLNQLATNSNGKSYFIDNSSSIINDLINDSRYATIQKSNKNIVPLIDWKYLLAIIVLSLASEWFIRKYNGLI
ncbi:hypothetical protein SAMN03097699_1046 [Flavobacteriaceae bacterium MAR_2010_188]|nr:hypothetical protein SAMN03097699_1046 [Flavobacteriaceae bacterium MAR_2010_188]